MNARRIKLIAAAGIAAVCLIFATVYFISYDHPIFIGDPELCEKYREVSLRYSHELMADFLGIPSHAQIITVRQGEGEIFILLSSFIPPSRTKVWHSEGDVPYWETGLGS